jgi:microcystin-dependent protein
LFALLGTNFGGDGRTTFALPDFRGRTALGTNAQFPVGTVVGQQFVTLTEAQMPEHVHALPDTAVPEPGTWALMIGGFGLAGAALRRRRAATA